MLLNLFWLILGVVMVILAAEAVVRGAASLAKRLRVSELFIGLTIVAFGTSLPELMVNLIASVDNNEGIVVGNIIGSNLFNVLLILGIGALIRELKVVRDTVITEISFSIIAVLMIGFAANDYLPSLNQDGHITRSDALQMLTVFGLFSYFVFLRGFRVTIDIDLDFKILPIWQIVFYLAGGFIALFWGGRLVVTEAIFFAEYFGVTQTFIGLTLVSGATSLPELATSVVAALRHRDNIAIGNVVGSNIFNSLFILPVSALVRDIPFEARINVDLGVLIIASFALTGFMRFRRRCKISRGNGVVLLIMYIAYMAFIFHRG
ncbi:MAG: calcium/sodium antiporter [candidate division KSB1 bacterium]|nr:calcium/sodium antiporter [candidate division KSB1 bacterium]